MPESILFVRHNCPACIQLEQFIDENEISQKLELKILEISQNPQNRAIYLKESEELGYQGDQVPLLISNGKYYEGQNSIITYLENPIFPDQDATAKSTFLSTTDSGKLNQLIAIQAENEEPVSVVAKSDSATGTGVYLLLFGLTIIGIIIFLRLRRRL